MANCRKLIHRPTPSLPYLQKISGQWFSWLSCVSSLVFFYCFLGHFLFRHASISFLFGTPNLIDLFPLGSYSDMLQGIPVGLAFGSIPFLLRARLSYTQIGLFSLASYPYSLKLLWSPIVDSCYFSSIGRRKSWIIPVQALVGVTLWWLGDHVNVLMDAEIPDVKTLTALFFTLVMFAATQDIAVDGWALELLSQDNLSYASTAQTVGLNIGCKFVLILQKHGMASQFTDFGLMLVYSDLRLSLLHRLSGLQQS
jgi:hypothetical protein